MKQIFTTKGWLPADEVIVQVTVTHEDEHSRVDRSDKYLKSTGEWVGNDLNVIIKKGKVFEGFSGTFS